MTLVNFCTGDHIVSHTAGLSMGNLISLYSVHGSLTSSTYWEKNISGIDFASEPMGVQYLSQFYVPILFSDKAGSLKAWG